MSTDWKGVFPAVTTKFKEDFSLDYAGIQVDGHPDVIRALVNNMVDGVTNGFSKELTIIGVGYRAAKKGSDLELQVGFSHPVVMSSVDGVSVEVPEPTKIIVSGIDKEAVGQVAANIRAVKPPEPYKGKGIRYTDEHVVRKAGKAGVR